MADDSVHAAYDYGLGVTLRHWQEPWEQQRAALARIAAGERDREPTREDELPPAVEPAPIQPPAVVLQRATGAEPTPMPPRLRSLPHLLTQAEAELAAREQALTEVEQRLVELEAEREEIDASVALLLEQAATTLQALLCLRRQYDELESSRFAAQLRVEELRLEEAVQGRSLRLRLRELARSAGDAPSDDRQEEHHSPAAPARPGLEVGDAWHGGAGEPVPPWYEVTSRSPATVYQAPPAHRRGTGELRPVRLLPVAAAAARERPRRPRPKATDYHRPAW